MPTPFMHLQMAKAMKTAVSQQQDENGRLLHVQLDTHWDAFCLGQIAPDFQPIAGVSRYDTHFYPIPLPDDHNTVQTMLDTHPSLQKFGEMPMAKRLFLAGYFAHLWYDVVWYRHVLIPHFWQNKSFPSREHARLVNFLMLAHFDLISYDQLDNTFRYALEHATPKQWLPIGTDAHLQEWAEFIAIQFAPDQPLKTLDVYAERLKMPPSAVKETFDDAAWMTTHVKSLVSTAQFDVLVQETAVSATEMLLHYLGDYLT